MRLDRRQAQVQTLSSAVARPGAECEDPQHDEVQDRHKAEKAPGAGKACFRYDAPDRYDVGAEEKEDDQPMPNGERAHDFPKVRCRVSDYF